MDLTAILTYVLIALGGVAAGIAGPALWHDLSGSFTPMGGGEKVNGIIQGTAQTFAQRPFDSFDFVLGLVAFSVIILLGIAFGALMLQAFARTRQTTKDQATITQLSARVDNRDYASEKMAEKAIDNADASMKALLEQAVDTNKTVAKALENLNWERVAELFAKNVQGVFPTVKPAAPGDTTTKER